jgi:hypothetical protein
MNAPQRIGRQLPAIAGKALGKKGLAFGALMAEWPSIVGARVAEQAAPLRLAFPAGQRDQAVLHVQVSSATALLVQHEEPLIVERINGFFGYRAVARLKLVHAAPARRAAVRTPRLSADQEAALQEQTATVEDPELRAVLQRLGRAVRR